MQENLHGSVKSIHRCQLQISIISEVDVYERSTLLLRLRTFVRQLSRGLSII